MYEKMFTTLTFYCFEKAHLFWKSFCRGVLRKKNFFFGRNSNVVKTIYYYYFLEKFSFIFIFKKKGKKFF